MRNGISINAIFIFPARSANAIINKMVIAFNRLLIKNVCGKNSIIPTMIKYPPKNGTMDWLMPRAVIIFSCAGCAG